MDFLIIAREGIARRILTEGLAGGGYSIGASQWTVRFKGEEKDAGSQVFDKQQTYNVPEVRGTFELVAPDGTIVGTVPYSGQFSKDKSSYLVRTKRDNAVETVYEYNFRGKPPREAILDECWAQVLEMLRSKQQLGTVWEINGKYQPLPVALQFPLPPGVKPPDYNAR